MRLIDQRHLLGGPKDTISHFKWWYLKLTRLFFPRYRTSVMADTTYLCPPRTLFIRFWKYLRFFMTQSCSGRYGRCATGLPREGPLISSFHSRRFVHFIYLCNMAGGTGLIFILYVFYFLFFSSRCPLVSSGRAFSLYLPWRDEVIPRTRFDQPYHEII